MEIDIIRGMKKIEEIIEFGILEFYVIGVLF